MARKKLRSLITSFSRDGDFLAVLSPNGTVKIWNTSNGNLLTEWKQSDDIPDVSYSRMACSFVGKKHRKGSRNFLLALGTDGGDVLSINVSSGEINWKSTGCCPGGVSGLSFASKGSSLCIVGMNRMVFEMNSETGELIREFKASKKSISSTSFSCDEKFLAVFDSKLRVLSLEGGNEILKFPDDLGLVQHISISDEAKTIVTSEEKHLQVWRCDLRSRSVSSGPVLSMRHPPLSFECKNRCNKEGGSVILAVSESGVGYLWNLESFSQNEVNPTKITVKANEPARNQEKNDSIKKGRISIIAARLHALEANEKVTALIAYGSVDSPHFSLLDLSNAGENIFVTVKDEGTPIQEHNVLAEKGIHNLEVEAAEIPTQKKKSSKKRAASDPDLGTIRDMADSGHGEVMDGVLSQDDVNEPTMGEKLASLNLLDNDKTKTAEEQESSALAKPPSADSVHVLLKQALRADDRALLLDCLYTQDEKVIANSISLLNPSDVLKLLHSILSMIQSRGAILVCTLPWLRCLLLRHASGIMSQESSMLALNSLYQLIESRVSTFHSALELSTCLDFLYAGIIDDEEDENGTVIPAIFEDNDDSDEAEDEDENENEDTMELDQDGEEDQAFDEVLDGSSDIEGNDPISD